MSKLHTLFIYSIYFISKFVPRNKNKFVYIGWHKNQEGEVFADNTKYLFLYSSKQSTDQKHIWIAKSQTLAKRLRASNLNSYYEFSIKGIWNMLQAKHFVIDAFLQPQHFMLSGQAKIIQLLHGKGMKKKGYSEAQLKRQDFIFGTSTYSLDLLPGIFKTGSELFVTGYPRNDVLYRDIENSNIDTDAEMLAHLKKQKTNGKINILYAPTFRRGEKQVLLKGIDIEKLDSWAKQKNLHIVISFHNKYRSQQENNQLNANVSFLKESDMYPLLNQFDLFVTDYSSSFVDFLLLDKPIIFYPFDFETYSVNEGIIQDYFEMIPGPYAMNFDQLLQRIEQVMIADTWQEKRILSKNKNHAFCDGNSAERIYKKIQEI